MRDKVIDLYAGVNKNREYMAKHIVEIRDLNIRVDGLYEIIDALQTCVDKLQDLEVERLTARAEEMLRRG